MPMPYFFLRYSYCPHPHPPFLLYPNKNYATHFYCKYFNLERMGGVIFRLKI